MDLDSTSHFIFHFYFLVMWYSHLFITYKICLNVSTGSTNSNAYCSVDQLLYQVALFFMGGTITGLFMQSVSTRDSPSLTVKVKCEHTGWRAGIASQPQHPNASLSFFKTFM